MFWHNNDGKTPTEPEYMAIKKIEYEKLKSALSEAKKEVERLRQYIIHYSNCAYEQNEKWECDCGYNERRFGTKVS